MTLKRGKRKHSSEAKHRKGSVKRARKRKIAQMWLGEETEQLPKKDRR